MGRRHWFADLLDDISQLQAMRWIKASEAVNEVHDTPGDDFIHVTGDGATPPPDYNEISLATNGDDIITCVIGADIVLAGFGNDFILGGVGRDTLNGEGNDDTLDGGINGDRLFGGKGSDTAAYDNSDAAVIVDLSADTNGTGGWAQADRYTSIENLRGSEFDDQLTGDEGANRLQGNGGVDRLVGLGQNDTLSGGAGNDWFFGGAGADLIVGGGDRDTLVLNGAGAAVVNMAIDLLAGTGRGGDAEFDQYVGIEDVISGDANDTITGSAVANRLWGNNGNDQLEGHGGRDTIFGGNGNDAAVYSSSSTGVTVDLSTGETSGGHAEGDELHGIESLLGSAFGDLLTGDKGDNILYGSGGGDELKGKGGADSFLYGDIADSPTEAGHFAGDTIRGFSSADGDKLVLSDMDADVLQPGMQNWVLIPGVDHFLGTPGQLIITGNTVQGNANGDTMAEFIIVFTGGMPTAADILL